MIDTPRDETSRHARQCECVSCMIKAAIAAWMRQQPGPEADAVELLAALAQVAGSTIAATHPAYRDTLRDAFGAAVDVSLSHGRAELATHHQPPARTQ